MNAILKQNYTQKLFIAAKMAYSCGHSFRGNLNIIDFPTKLFYNINPWAGFRQNEFSIYIYPKMFRKTNRQRSSEGLNEWLEYFRRNLIV